MCLLTETRALSAQGEKRALVGNLTMPHPRAGDSDPVQDPKPGVDLAMAFAVERGPREIGPNRRQ